MGLYNILKEQLSGVSPKWSNVKVNLRGVPFYVDTLLTGVVRFARRTGSIGLLNPDIETSLQNNISTNQNFLTLNRYNSWYVPNAYINVGNLEKFRIDSIDNTTVYLNVDAKINQSSGTKVFLYSIPCLVVNTATKNDKFIDIRSKFPVINNDRICIEILQNLFHETKILNVENLGDTNNEYFHTYRLFLEEGLSKNFSPDDEIQLKALPAYFSPVLKVSKNPKTQASIGPFIIDAFNGRIENGQTQNSTMTVQLYDIFGDKLLSTEPFSINKNYPVFARSFSGETILFWDLITGSFKRKNIDSICVCDDTGRFGCTYDMQPPIKAGNFWRIQVTSSHDAVLRIGFEPNEFQTFNLTSKMPVGIVVGTYASLPDIEKITILVSSVANAEIEMGEWTLKSSEVDRVSFNIMVEETEEAKWLSTGLIIKPYFLSIDYLKTQYDDSDAKYDSGLTYL